MINLAEARHVCAINLRTLLSAGLLTASAARKGPEKSRTPVHSVPVVMKSGNKGVARACIQHRTTRKLQGRCGTAVHGVPMPETANRHSPPLPF